MNANDIREWYERDRAAIIYPEKAQELYFAMHPRIVAMKVAPRNARVADIGAGDGTSVVFKAWPEPTRSDLKMHAYALDKGARFEEFESYALGDWNAQRPMFDRQPFDLVICAHFIEHIDDPLSIVDWLDTMLANGGTAYIEWPSTASIELPPIDELRKLGVDIMISNFRDDDTHQTLPDRDHLREKAVASGYEIMQEGIIRMPWIEEQLMANFRDADDGFLRQAAFWLMTGWSQFVMLRKPLDWVSPKGT